MTRRFKFFRSSRYSYERLPWLRNCRGILVRSTALDGLSLCKNDTTSSCLGVLSDHISEQIMNIPKLDPNIHGRSRTSLDQSPRISLEVRKLKPRPGTSRKDYIYDGTGSSGSKLWINFLLKTWIELPKNTSFIDLVVNTLCWARINRAYPECKEFKAAKFLSETFYAEPSSTECTQNTKNPRRQNFSFWSCRKT